MKSKIAEDLECIVMYSGEDTIKQCLESISKQTLQPFKFETVGFVSPINESINKRHELMSLPYSIKVDADMILYPHCFDFLYRKIKQSNKNIYSVTGMLDDPFIGFMGAVHMEKTKLVKDINIPDIIGCDRCLRTFMLKKGYAIQEFQEVVAQHWCDWSEEAIFKRHVRVGQKLAYYKTQHYDDWILEIGHRWMEWNRDSPFLALLGLCYGLLVPDQKEKGKGFADKEWETVKNLISRKVIPKADYLYSQKGKT